MAPTELRITTRDDLAPVCPHCQVALTEVYMRAQGLGILTGKNILYFCPHCQKVLGFGQSRMM